MSDDEVAAVNVLFAESRLPPIDGIKEYSYKRAGKSCCKIVQFFSQVTEPENLFGEVRTFVTTGSFHLALLKQYPILASAICSLNITPPSDEIVKLYADAKLLEVIMFPLLAHLGLIFLQSSVRIL